MVDDSTGSVGHAGSIPNVEIKYVYSFLETAIEILLAHAKKDNRR
jgi:hypothetical protein